MLNIIKTGTYYFLFKKFKKQIFIVLFSLIAIFVIDSIFKDIISALDKNEIFFAIAIKWTLIIFIIFFNFFMFKKSTKKLSKQQSQPKLNEKTPSTTPYFEEVLKKDKLLTKKEKIFKKYLKN